MKEKFIQKQAEDSDFNGDKLVGDECSNIKSYYLFFLAVSAFFLSQYST